MNKAIELGYIDYIVNQKFDRDNIEWSFITEESKNDVESKITPFEDFLKEHTDFENYTTEQKDNFFAEAVKQHEAFKASIKSAVCQIEWQGREVKFIKDRLEDHVEYDAASIFAGVHLKGVWLNKLEYDLSKLNNIKIGMPETVVLYDLLSKTTIKGLKEGSFIYAKVLKQLAECSKIYQYYDNTAARLGKLLVEWNMGLSNDDKELVHKAMLQEAITAGPEGSAN